MPSGRPRIVLKSFVPGKCIRFIVIWVCLDTTSQGKQSRVITSIPGFRSMFQHFIRKFFPVPYVVEGDCIWLPSLSLWYLSFIKRQLQLPGASYANFCLSSSFRLSLKLPLCLHLRDLRISDLKVTLEACATSFVKRKKPLGLWCLPGSMQSRASHPACRHGGTLLSSPVS